VNNNKTRISMDDRLILFKPKRKQKEKQIDEEKKKPKLMKIFFLFCFCFTGIARKTKYNSNTELSSFEYFSSSSLNAWCLLLSDDMWMFILFSKQTSAIWLKLYSQKTYRDTHWTRTRLH